MKLQDRLKKFRAKNNLTQSGMANLIGCSLRAYQYWEKGANPNGNWLVCIADVIGQKISI